MAVRRPGVRPAWVDDELFGFESRFVRVAAAGGGEHVVHVVDEGPFVLAETDAPTLLLLHGNPTWSFLWRDVLPLLAGRFRCVAVDLPGFGLSSAAAGWGGTAAEHARVLGDVVEALDLTDVVPVGHEWGGPLGLAWAARHPDRVRGLVLSSTWGWPRGREPRAAAGSLVLGGPLTRGLVARDSTLVERLLPRLHRGREVTAAEMAHWRGPFPDAGSRRPAVVLAGEVRGAGPLLREVGAGLRGPLRDRPVLLLWPERDPLLGRGTLRRWRRLVPRATTTHLPGSGHLAPLDEPEAFARGVLDWWAGVVGAG